MLYTIIRFVTFMAVFAAAAFGLFWISQQEGQLMIEFAGTQYSFSILMAIGMLVAFIVALWLFWKVVGFGVALIGLLMGDKKAVSRFFAKRAQKKGMSALSNTVEAMATGDSKTALSQAYKADKHLDQPVLTGLLLAQSAKAAGKSDEAEAAYKKVLESGNGRFAAIRGLMGARLNNGDRATALKLAEKAFAMKSNDLETVNTLFELQVDEKQWDAARKTLSTKAKLEKLPSDFVSRREAVMALCEAKAMTVETPEDKTKYLDRVMLSHRLAPNLVPASIMAANAKAEDGNVKAADTVLVKAWNAMPHPEIARAYAELNPDETADARLRRFNVLTKRRKDDPETRMLKAELLIAAEQFPEARRALGDLETVGETSRALSIMAAIEHGEGADEAIVRAYLARAASASRGKQWVCNSCHHVHTEWVSDCVECELFDTLDWTLPPEAKDEQAAGMGVLMPLLTTSPKELDVVEAEVVEATEATKAG